MCRRLVINKFKTCFLKFIDSTAVKDVSNNVDKCTQLCVPIFILYVVGSNPLKATDPTLAEHYANIAEVARWIPIARALNPK